jgi:hypothetical protein
MMHVYLHRPIFILEILLDIVGPVAASYRPRVTGIGIRSSSSSSYRLLLLY